MPKVSPSPGMECLCSWKSTNAQLSHCHRWQHPVPACRHRISNTALRIQPQRGCTTLCRSAGHIEDGCGDSAHCPRGPVAGPHPEAHCARPPGGLHLQHLPQAGSRLRALCPQGGLHRRASFALADTNGLALAMPSMAHRTLCVMPQPDVSHPADQ